MRTIMLAIALALATVALYWPVHTHEFVNFDDTLYVTDNALVQQGLTPTAVRWALTTGDAANWHPLTWWSHMLDVQLFDVDPGPHHLVNLGLHALNVVVLFLVLQRLTGAAWRSALVAGLFALHPLNVESVAWIAQRKTLLSAFFALLTIGAYAGWAEHRKVGSYVLVLLFYVLSLMAKPISVTLPFVLLLLDYWPLGRLRGDGTRPTTVPVLLAEKLPLFALSVASSVVTYMVQEQGGAMRAVRPLGDRFVNALVSYADYVRAALWPRDLALLYPFPATWTTAVVASAVAIVGGLTLLAIGLRRRQPHVFVGWFLFLGMLVPMIGLVQVGFQARADHHVYLPLIGLFLMVVWSLPAQPLVGAVLAAVVLAGLGTLTWRQVAVWRNSKTLLEHSLAIAPDSAVAHQDFAMVLLDDGGADQKALAEFQEALRLDARLAGAYTGLAAVYAREGKLDDSEKACHEALAIDPDLAAAHAQLSSIYGKQGKVDDSLREMQAAIQAEPLTVAFHYSLGMIYDAQKNPEAAIGAYREALRLRPAFLEALAGLGNALIAADRQREAIETYRELVLRAPGLPFARHNLAWLLLAKPERTPNDISQALTLLEQAVQITNHKDPRMLDTLAVGNAIAKHFDEAVSIDNTALELARSNNDTDLVAEIQQNLKRFEEMRAEAAAAPNT